MHILFARTVVPAVAVCALTLAACSAASRGISASSGASTSAAAADAVHESGRTLTQAQLLAAGLQVSQWPKDVYALLDSGSVWEASHPPASPAPRSSAACQPLLDVMQGTSGASAAVDVSFQQDGLIGVVNLDSYPQGRASALFASVRRAAASCPGVNIPSYLGTFYNKVVVLRGPSLGDESISFGLTRNVEGTAALDRFDYVRVGAVTVLIRQIGASPTAPPLIPRLLAPQVANIQAAQS
jgi:hypothetical protein